MPSLVSQSLFVKLGKLLRMIFFFFLILRYFFRAAHSNLPLYQYIAKLSNSNIRLPVPAFNVILNYIIELIIQTLNLIGYQWR
jgi:hypothetical protein